MAGSIASIIAAVEVRLVALGFVKAAELFSFDAVPSSIVHKAYRLETRLIGNAYNIGDQANPREAIEIYIAYKLHRVTANARATALDDRETIEKDIINAAGIQGLASDPLLMLDTEASLEKYLEGFLVSKIVFNCDYLRDISA